MMESTENSSLHLPLTEKALPRLPTYPSSNQQKSMIVSPASSGGSIYACDRVTLAYTSQHQSIASSSSASSALKSCSLFPRVLVSVQQHQQSTSNTTSNTANVPVTQVDQSQQQQQSIPSSSVFQLSTAPSVSVSNLPTATLATPASQTSTSSPSTPFFPLILAAATSGHPSVSLAPVPVSLQLHVNSSLQPSTSVTSSLLHHHHRTVGSGGSANLLPAPPASGGGGPTVVAAAASSKSGRQTATASSSASLIASFVNRTVVTTASSATAISNNPTFASVVITPQTVASVQSSAFALRFTTTPTITNTTTVTADPSDLTSASSTGGGNSNNPGENNIAIPCSVVACRTCATSTTCNSSSTMVSIGPGSSLVFSSLSAGVTTTAATSTATRMLVHKPAPVDQLAQASSLSFVVADPNHHPHQFVASIPSNQSCRAKYINIGAATTSFPVIPTHFRLMPTTNAPTSAQPLSMSTSPTSIVSTANATVLLPSVGTSAASLLVKPSSLSSPTAAGGCVVSPNKYATVTTNTSLVQQSQRTWSPLLPAVSISGGVSTALTSVNSETGSVPAAQHLLVHATDDGTLVTTALRAHPVSAAGGCSTAAAAAASMSGGQVPPTVLTFSLAPAGAGLIPTTPSPQVGCLTGAKTLAVSYAAAAAAQSVPSLVIRTATTGCSPTPLTFSVSPGVGGGNGAALSATSLLKPFNLVSTSNASNITPTSLQQSHGHHVVPVNIAPATRASGHNIAVTTATFSPLRSSIVSTVTPSLLSVSPSPISRQSGGGNHSSIFPFTNATLSASLASSRKRARKQQLAMTSPTSGGGVVDTSVAASVKPATDSDSKSPGLRPAPATLLPLSSGRPQQLVCSAVATTVVTFSSNSSSGRSSLVHPSPATCLHLLPSPTKAGQQIPSLVPAPSSTSTDWTTNIPCPTVNAYPSAGCPTLTMPTPVMTTTTTGGGGLVGIRLLSVRPTPASASPTISSTIGASLPLTSVLSSQQLTSPAGESNSLVVLPITTASCASATAPTASNAQTPPVFRLTSNPGSNTAATTLLSPTQPVLEPAAFFVLPPTTSAAPPANTPESTTAALVAAVGGLVQLRYRPQPPAVAASCSPPSLTSATVDGLLKSTDIPLMMVTTTAADGDAASMSNCVLTTGKTSVSPPLASCVKAAAPVRSSLVLNHHTSLLHRHLRSTSPPPLSPAIVNRPDNTSACTTAHESSPSCLTTDELLSHLSAVSSDPDLRNDIGRNLPSLLYDDNTNKLGERRATSGISSTKRNRLSTGVLTATSGSGDDLQPGSRWRKRLKLSHALVSVKQPHKKALEDACVGDAVTDATTVRRKGFVGDDSSLHPVNQLSLNEMGNEEESSVCQGAVAVVKWEGQTETDRRLRSRILSVDPSTECEWFLTRIPPRPSIFNSTQYGDTSMHTRATSANINWRTKSTHFLKYSEIRSKPEMPHRESTANTRAIGYSSGGPAVDEDTSARCLPPQLSHFDQGDPIATERDDDDDVGIDEDGAVLQRRRSTRRAAVIQRTAVLTRRQAAAREKKHQQLDGQQQVQHRCHQPSLGALQRRLLRDLLTLRLQQEEWRLVRFPITSVSPLDMTGWRVISCSNNLTQLIMVEHMDLAALDKLKTRLSPCHSFHSCLLSTTERTLSLPPPSPMTSDDGAATPGACCCRHPRQGGSNGLEVLGCLSTASLLCSLPTSSTSRLATPASICCPVAPHQQATSVAGTTNKTATDVEQDVKKQTVESILDVIKGIHQRKQQLVTCIQRLQQHTFSLVEHFRPRALQLLLDLDVNTGLTGDQAAARRGSAPSPVAADEDNDDGDGDDNQNGDTDEEEDVGVNRTASWSDGLRDCLLKKPSSASGATPLRRSTRQRRRGRSSPSIRARRMADSKSKTATADSGASAPKMSSKRRSPGFYSATNSDSTYKQQPMCNGLGRTSGTRK